MQAIADTNRLVTDGVITPEQARTIEIRAREAMVALSINSVLCLGIVAATMGLIFWLADALAVAVFGTLALVVGFVILIRGGELFRIFGNAAALIGAGMLIGGAGAELLDNYEDIAGWAMAAVGMAILLITAKILMGGWTTARFVIGSILIMGLALHVVGLGVLLDQQNLAGAAKVLFFLYAALVIAGAGLLTDVRAVTALAIVPFAQALDTGTEYFHAIYVFYSQESTLSILQMVLLIVLCLWAADRWRERVAPHARVLAVMAFIVANLCALVGSLWGDVVGETIWGPGYRPGSNISWEEYRAARDAFMEDALVISEGIYSIAWAVVLAAMVFWAAHANRRGLFNAAVTFGAIHAYTQLFESFSDQPLAYVIGGLAAIPLAWGMWRLNHWLAARTRPSASLE
ncbi:MAG: hypothetical protein AAF982_08360 [Pseudomonadota bacterium]